MLQKVHLLISQRDSVCQTEEVCKNSVQVQTTDLEDKACQTVEVCTNAVQVQTTVLEEKSCQTVAVRTNAVQVQTTILPEVACEKKKVGGRLLQDITNTVRVQSTACNNGLVSSQREYEFSANFYKAEKYFADKDIETLKEEVRRLQKHSFGFFSMANDNAMCLFYTGLHLEIFDVLEKLCSSIKFDYYNGIRVEIIPFKDQLLLTLIKLRQNLAYLDLGWRFGISDTTAYRIFCTFLPVLHKIVSQSVMQKIPSRAKNKSSLPMSFNMYKNCRCVIDCTEMRCQVPKRMDYQKSTYSSYKQFTTLKVLLVVSPNGTIIYCSSCFPGSTSDKQIFLHCGIIKHLVAGDMIIADKGFLISDIVPPGVTVNIPPFLTSQQFTPSQVTTTRNIARARIHVERANARLKHYQILTCFPRSLFCRASMIVQVCAGLVNFQNPLIKEVEQNL